MAARFKIEQLCHRVDYKEESSGSEPEVVEESEAKSGDRPKRAGRGRRRLSAEETGSDDDEDKPLAAKNKSSRQSSSEGEEVEDEEDRSLKNKVDNF